MEDNTLRDLFRGYYHPTQAEWDTIWRDGLIVLDANILLSLYKVHEHTSGLYLDAMERRKEQMWIPYQVAAEFHRNVHKERAKQKQTTNHTERIGKIKQLLDHFRSTDKKTRIYTAPPPSQEEALAGLEKLKQELYEQKKEIERQTHHNTPDALLDRIANVFDNGVGNKPGPEDLERMSEEAEERFNREIPPGYKDSGKDGNRKYGDYILWRQLLDHSSTVKRHVVFVTDDDKLDWWLKGEDGTSLAPRPELVQEFRDVTGQDILILNSEQFYYSLVPASDDNPDESAKVLAAQEDMKAAVSEAKEVAPAESEGHDVIDLMEALKRSLDTKRRIGLRNSGTLSPHSRMHWKMYAEKPDDANPVVRDLKNELLSLDGVFDFLEHDAAVLHYDMEDLSEDDPGRALLRERLSEVHARIEGARGRKAEIEALLRIIDRNDSED
ncbi:PIN domain-containing protein [Paenarthrobacter nicotinovorans]|uniref:PIN domain-containing protein n=1 Tax=Paenarthrobacter nicotinovorans TaxID=29320 RepID=UPI0038044F37